MTGAASVAQAGAIPMIGGGQVGMKQAPMIHTDIFISSAGVSVTLMNGNMEYVEQLSADEVPMLRPLAAPNHFEGLYAVLEGKDYNFQYAWNAGNLAYMSVLPEGTDIWIKRLEQDAGLESYKRPPAQPSYGPIFTSDGEIWKWATRSMTHNVYAVLDPTQDTYRARYEVYVGDAAGVPFAGMASDTIEWVWRAEAIPEPASLGVLALGGVMLLARRRHAR